MRVWVGLRDEGRVEREDEASGWRRDMVVCGQNVYWLKLFGKD